MTPYVPPGVDVAAALRATERAHLPISGYGVKSFTLAMVKAAINVSARARCRRACSASSSTLGLAMLTEDVRLLPDVPAVLADLARDHRLVLITKGDLVHQTRKVEMSGIAHHFELVEVVLEKDPETYARILRQLDVAPERFCMVGNSVRSDILPGARRSAATPCTSRTRCCGSTSTSTTTRTSTSWRRSSELPAALRAPRH